MDWIRLGDRFFQTSVLNVGCCSYLRNSPARSTVGKQNWLSIHARYFDCHVSVRRPAHVIYCAIRAKSIDRMTAIQMGIRGHFHNIVGPGAPSTIFHCGIASAKWHFILLAWAEFVILSGSACRFTWWLPRVCFNDKYLMEAPSLGLAKSVYYQEL